MDKVGIYEFMAEPFHCDFLQRLFMGHLGDSLSFYREQTGENEYCVRICKTDPETKCDLTVGLHRGLGENTLADVEGCVGETIAEGILRLTGEVTIGAVLCSERVSSGAEHPKHEDP